MLSFIIGSEKLIMIKESRFSIDSIVGGIVSTDRNGLFSEEKLTGFPALSYKTAEIWKDPISENPDISSIPKLSFSSISLISTILLLRTSKI